LAAATKNKTWRRRRSGGTSTPRIKTVSGTFFVSKKNSRIFFAQSPVLENFEDFSNPQRPAMEKLKLENVLDLSQMFKNNLIKSK
jgi:hypothetical protein